MIELFVMLFRILFIVLFALMLIPVLVLLERKISAFIQDRPGPNRTNIAKIRLGGVSQALADALKLLFKEDFMPRSVSRDFLFSFAPIFLFFASLMTLAVVPFADAFYINGKSYLMQGVPFEGGLLWYLGFAGLSVYSIILAGYSSSNKYALLGSLRGASSVISYEIPMGLSVVSIILTYNSINLNDFVSFQEGSYFGLPAWGILVQPLAAIIFIVCAFAETNRNPFDLAEGESEIVGYHVEYSAMRFGMFFMAEYIAMVAASALIVTLFFGGYSLPFLSSYELKDNYQVFLIIFSAFTTIFGVLFVLWLRKNNVTRYKTKQDLRAFENKFYTICTIIFVLVADLLSLYFIFTPLGDLGKEIMTLTTNMAVFMTKTMIMLFVFIWVRWTLPRFRYDKLQRLGWENLMPLAIINLIITAVVVSYGN